MKTYALVIFFCACAIPISANTNSDSLRELVCQQCRQQCGTNQRNFGTSRLIGGNQGSAPRGIRGPPGLRGERGPQGGIGLPGPRGPEGVINITMIEEIVDKKIKIALTQRGCEQVQLGLEKKRNDTGGIFDIYAPGIGETELYCDTTTDGGGWTVFQRRMDGSVDFFRGWNDYVNGFGNKQREFWLGLETIHQMTKNGDYELRIDMITTDGIYRYAKYGSFSLGPASDNYRLSVSGYSGNATNQLLNHNLMQFSTKDNDNDEDNGSFVGNCALRFTGAWWYKLCHDSNLNGVYRIKDTRGVWWKNTSNRYAEMKFRKKN